MTKEDAVENGATFQPRSCPLGSYKNKFSRSGKKTRERRKVTSLWTFSTASIKFFLHFGDSKHEITLFTPHLAGEWNKCCPFLCRIQEADLPYFRRRTS